MATLSSTLSHLGRKLLRGVACGKSTDANGENILLSLTNAQVLGKLRFAPLSLEFSIRRIRYDQQLARRLVKHRQVFATMFGQFPFESEPTVAPDGTVQKSYPWVD